MSREIKFRAWDKERNVWEGEMVDGLVPEPNEFNLTSPWPDTSSYFGDCIANHPEKYILMQYTGLKDKNGKEIYEGDIILRNGGDNYIVELDECGWYAMYYDYQDDLLDYEIIGNLYENSELIEK